MMYWAPVVSQVGSTEFMEVDPRSIIEALNGLFGSPIYNMNLQYHSRYYGWTYFAINFIILSPLKLAHINDPVIINTTVQATLFLIGMLLVVAFYFACLRFLKHGKVALALTILFILNPIACHYFVKVHPETTGLLFYLLGVLALARFDEQKFAGLKPFVLAILFFSLSSLSKQPFFITSFLTLAYFVYHYAERNRRSLKDYLASREFARAFMLTLGIFLAVAFVVHPYGFIEFRTFVRAQLFVASISSGSVERVFPLWLNEVSHNPVIVVNFLLMALIPFRKRLELPTIFVYSVIASSLTAFLFMYMQKLFIRANYMYPLYPLFFVNIAYVALRLHRYVQGDARRYLRYALAGAALVVCVPLFLLSAVQTTYHSYKRYFLDGRTTAEYTWAYIKGLPGNSKIYYMPGVAIPPEYRKASCHVWRDCDSLGGLRIHSPDYVFVAWDYGKFNWEPLKAYMKETDYTLVDKITPQVRLRESCGGFDTKVDPSAPFFRPVRNMALNLLPTETFRRVEGCVEKIGLLRQVYAENMLEGPQWEIYKKSP